MDLPTTSTGCHHTLRRHVFVDDIRALLNEQRVTFESGLGDLREEMNARFTRFENELGGHVTGLRLRVTDEINVIRHGFDEIATEIREHDVADEYGEFGLHDNGGYVARSDVFTPNASANKHNLEESAEAVVCNVPDASITSAGRVGVLGSVYVACDTVKEVSTIVLIVDASNDDQLVDDSIVARPSTIADPSTRRPRSLRMKKASVNTRTPFMRSDRKREKRDA